MEACAPRKTYLVTMTRFDAPTSAVHAGRGLSKRNRRRKGGGCEKWIGLPYQSQSRIFSRSAQRRIPIETWAICCGALLFLRERNFAPR
jgi:hypothetical protein